MPGEQRRVFGPADAGVRQGDGAVGMRGALLLETLLRFVLGVASELLQPREQVGGETFGLLHQRRRSLLGPEELIEHALGAAAVEVFGFHRHAEWARRYVHREHEFGLLGRVVDADGSQRLECLALLVEQTEADIRVSLGYELERRAGPRS